MGCVSGCAAQVYQGAAQVYQDAAQGDAA